MDAPQYLDADIRGGDIQVRVRDRVAVPWKVLGACSNTSALYPANICPGMPRDHRAVRSERANADHRISRVRIDVHGGGDVDVDASGTNQATNPCCCLLSDIDVIDTPEDCVARHGRPGGYLEPGDISTLLVHTDQCVGVRGMALMRT